jgi:hypothetical protein
MRCPLCGHEDARIKGNLPREDNSWRSAAWGLARNGAAPAAPAHAPPPPEQGAANTPAKAQEQISACVDNAQPDARIGAGTSGTAVPGSGAKAPGASRPDAAPPQPPYNMGSVGAPIHHQTPDGGVQPVDFQTAKANGPQAPAPASAVPAVGAGPIPKSKLSWSALRTRPSGRGPSAI